MTASWGPGPPGSSAYDTSLKNLLKKLMRARKIQELTGSGKAAYVFDRFSTASSEGSGLSTGNFTVTAVPSPGLL